MKTLFACACMMAAFASHGHSQEKQVTLQFVTFPKWTTRQPIEMALGNGETIEIIAPSNSFSKPCQVPRMKSWVFGKAGVDDKGKPVFKTYGQCESLGSDKQLVLLIRKGDDPAEGLRVIPLDSRLSEFGGGEFFFMNASDFQVGGIMGKTKFLVEPAEHKIIKLASKDLRIREGIPFIQTALFYRRGDESNPFFNSTWHANPKARSMIFFYHSGAKGRLRMHTIQDFLP